MRTRAQARVSFPYKSRTDTSCQRHAPRYNLTPSPSARKTVLTSTMYQSPNLWPLLLLLASTALSLVITNPNTITLSTSPATNITTLQLPPQPSTNLTSTSVNARCYKGSFNLFHRIHFGDCRAAIATLPPNNPRAPLYPVEKSYKWVTLLSTPSQIHNTDMFRKGSVHTDMDHISQQNMSREHQTAPVHHTRLSRLERDQERGAGSDVGM